MKTKICPCCKVDKPISDFYPCPSRKSGLTVYCKECKLAKAHERYYRNHEPWIEQQHEGRQRVKSLVLTHYGNGKLACVHCGFDNMRALSIDHIDGGGAEHKRKLGRTGIAFYRWLKKQGFPEGFQTLCMNCQFIKVAENNEHTKGRPRIYF